jgi:hypothetical protein
VIFTGIRNLASIRGHDSAFFRGFGPPTNGAFSRQTTIIGQGAPRWLTPIPPRMVMPDEGVSL